MAGHAVGGFGARRARRTGRPRKKSLSPRAPAQAGRGRVHRHASAFAGTGASLAAHAPGPVPAQAPGARIDWPRSLLARRAERTPTPADGAGAPGWLRWRADPAPAHTLQVFLLDCSASMVQSGALGVAKAVLLALMAHAYRQRHEVCLIVFGGEGARMPVSPQRASWQNDGWVKPLPGGGGTPMQAALDMAHMPLRSGRFAHHVLWLLSDARVHGPLPEPPPAQVLRVLDFEHGSAHRRLGRAQALARQWQADYLAPASAPAQ